MEVWKIVVGQQDNKDDNSKYNISFESMFSFHNRKKKEEDYKVIRNLYKPWKYSSSYEHNNPRRLIRRVWCTTIEDHFAVVQA